MALMKAKEIPEDGVALDELEATEYVWNLVFDWETTSDTWALKYAPVALGGLNALCGVLINRHFRKKLNLGNYGYFASVVPITLMPAVLTALFHRQLISTDLLLMKNQGCPLCYEVRSAAVQCSLGTAYPMILAPTSALMFANRYSTYRVPNLNEGAAVIFKFLRKVTRPYNSTLTFMIVAQVLASSIFTYYEMVNNLTLRSKIMEIEAKLEKGQQ
uniref:Transmembrane protein 126A n=1 Tax=Heliothis virescens TaxID=7102 RepID=A0A2A4JG62_HELVI